MEENNMDEQERLGDQAKTWVQENLRVIVSIFIVAAIALGIYSYSQRSEDTVKKTSDSAATEEVSGTSDSAATTDNSQDVKKNSPAVTTPTRPAEMSKETETAFVETATRGDGSTHLARSALMHYLEKTPDSSLSGAQKVYIEDYLRKHTGHRGHLAVGQSLEFSKDLIRQAIDQSKTLTGGQLKHLQMYAQRVSAYRS